ncbi:MAG: autotransporter-associated beta strand repeat-containing protein [Verrucomicrobiota bacterium]
MKRKHTNLFLLSAATFVVTASSAHADTVTRATSGTDLTAGTSWAGTVPTTGDIATWSGSSLGGVLTLNQTDTTTQTWGAIEVQNANADIVIGTTSLGNATPFSTGATTITVANAAGLSLGSIITGTGIAAGTTVTAISGSTITLSTATTAANTGTAIAVTPVTLNLTGNQTVQGVANTGIYLAATGKNLTINQGIALGGAQTWFVGTGRSLNLNGAGTGAVDLTLSGPGTVVVGNSAAFGTGDIFVTESLRITNNVGFANDITIATGKTLTLGSSDFVFNAVSGVISGDGGLTANGNVRLSGNNTFKGNFLGSGGHMTITNDAALGASTNTVTFTGGTLSTFNAGAAVNLTRNIILSNGISVDMNGQDLTLGGIISGAGGLGIASTNTARTMTLSGLNTYIGATSVAGSTLSINSIKNADGTSASALGTVTSANGTIGFNNATLKYTGAGDTTNRVINLSGTTGGATLDQSGASGLLTFTSNFTATGVGSKALTLTGTGTGEIAGAIVNNPTMGSTKLAANYAANATIITLASVDGLAAGQTITIAGLSTTIASINTVTKVVTLNAGTATAATAGASIFSAALTNLTSVTKSGTGTWTLSGANTYSGATTLSTGTLQAGSNTAFGTGALTLNGGTLSSNAAAGAGDRSIGNAVTVGGDITLGNATNTGVINFTSTVGLGGTQRRLTVNSDVNMSGAVSGSAGLFKSGGGTLTFSGANTYSGTTEFNAGVLASGTNTVFGTGTLKFSGGTIASSDSTSRNFTNSDIDYASSSTFGTTTTGDLKFTGNLRLGGVQKGLTINNSVTEFSGLVSDSAGTNSVTKDGAGTLIFSGTNTYVRPITVNAGTMKFAKTVSFYGNVVNTANAAKLTVNSGATGAFNIGGTGEFSEANIITILGASNGSVGFKTGAKLGLDTTGGNFGYTANLANPTGSTSLGLTKLGTNTLTLTGTNTYTGNTTISGGSLEIGGVGTLGNGTYAGNISNAGTFLVSTSANQALSGTISGVGVLTKSGDGTLTLSGTNTYTGNTSVTAGRLVVGVVGVGSITSNVEVASGATLGGSGTITGNVALNGGKLTVGNSPGTMTVTGDMSFNSGSIFEWKLASNTESAVDRGTAFDAVDLTGATKNLVIDETAGTGALFKVVLGTDFNGADAFWTATRSWDVFNVAGTSSSSFQNFALFNASNTTASVDYSTYGTFTYGYADNKGTLTWSAVPEPSSAMAGLLLAVGLLGRRRKNCTTF